MKYVESNIPSKLRVFVRYTTRFRAPDQSKYLPKWHTQCELVDEEGNVVAFASSNCNEEDQPVRKIGRAIAVGKAFKKWYTRGGNQSAL